MTPLSLLRLSKFDIAIANFFTESDKVIPADILTVNDSTSEVIIQSSKSIDSKILFAKIYAFNREKKIKLEVTKELNAINQYKLKVNSEMEHIESIGVTNTYGGISVEAPIPSLKFSIDEGAETEPLIIYKCYVVSSDFLVIETKNDSLYSNIFDCIKNAIEINLRNKNNDDAIEVKILPISIFRLSKNLSLVKIANNDECKHISSIFDVEIKESFDKLIAKNTVYINEIFNKCNS